MLPAPHFTAFQLRKLRKTISSHQRLLSETYSDVTEGYEPVYALDFQEIYSYIFPYAVDSDEAVVVEYVLNNLKAPFVLLSGTWLELINKLQDVLANVSTVTSMYNLLKSENVDTKAIEFIKGILDTNPDDVIIDSIDFGNDLHKLSIDISGAVAKYVTTFERLTELLNKPTHVKLSQLLQHKERLVFDEAILTKFDRALDQLRPGSKSNYPDAANLAGIVALREYFNERAKYEGKEKLYKFYLLSHTPTMLNLDNFATDEFGEIGSMLTRTPLSVMYQILLQGDSIQDTLEAINRRIDLCDSALRSVRHVALEIAIATKKEFLSGRLSDIRLVDQKELALKSQKLKQIDISAFINYVHDPIIEEINKVMVNDQVIQFNKLQVKKSKSDSVPTHEHADSIDELKSLLLNITKEKLSDSLNNIEMANSRIVVSGNECERTHVLRHVHSDLVFSLDNYFHFFSAYWPTNRNISQFYQVVKTSIEVLLESSPLLHDPQRKMVLLLATDRTVHKTSLFAEDLGVKSLESIFQFENDEVATFMRLATPWGDFCYDIQPLTADKSTYMGFVSKLQLTHFLTDLVFLTTVEPTLLPGILEEYIQPSLSSYPIPS